MGFSMGGWAWDIFVTYKPTGTDYSYYNKITSMVNIQGVNPSHQYDSTYHQPAQASAMPPSATGSICSASKQVLDGRGIDGLTKNMNDSAAGSSNFLWTNFGASGHSNFNDFYNPSTTNWTLTNADVQLSNGSELQSPPAGGQNVYQWALRQGDTTIYAYSSGSLTVSAGADIDLYMPVDSTVLSAAITGTPTSISWVKLSGPTQKKPWLAQPKTPTTANTKVQQMGIGVYTYQVTVSHGVTTKRDTVVGRAEQGRCPSSGTRQQRSHSPCRTTWDRATDTCTTKSSDISTPP
jgi:hypothetical protein